MKLTKPDRERIEAILAELKAHASLHRMREYVQHGGVSTYDHCERVARLSYWLNRRLHLHADERVLLRGAMLHDFYLYDWHENDDSHRWHGFTHAAVARENAARHFHIGRREKQVFESHMWPLTLTRLPRSREAWIVCLADKWCSLQETLLMRDGRKPRE